VAAAAACAAAAAAAWSAPLLLLGRPAPPAGPSFANYFRRRHLHDLQECEGKAAGQCNSNVNIPKPQ
jgi:hypothetical protein